MDAVHTRRGFARCLLALLPLGRALAAEQPKGETLRGKLIIRSGQPPAADTPDHGRVLLDSDDANLKVLHDDRINGFEMEARGHFTAPGRFLIDAQHTRSLLVRDHDGRLKMVTYWCDVCGIRAYTPGPCVCCQKNTDLDLREPDDSMNANYSARQSDAGGIATVQLADTARQTTLSIVPGVGNVAYEWQVAGRNFLHFPYASVAEFAQRPRLCGVPFLAPWANRLDGDGFWANGKRYLLNAELGNLRRDGNQKPIHGLLSSTNLWKVVEAKADDGSAWATSRLEYGRYPDLLAQFPFPHTLTMTHRLRDGAVEVETTIENHGTDPMPVGVGFHPYFALHDVHRDQWHVHLAARDHLVLNQQLIPTGERKPIEFADPHSLSTGQLDDVFANLIRDPDGRARFHVEGGRERITVAYGPKYTVAVVYAPKGQDFICFEPMSAVTNAFNLAHDGKYGELQSVAPGGTWRESFWLSVG